MSSVSHLREFVNERLTAAAEEIFGVFIKTIIEYEEEIDRQRKLLDICWKPELKIHRMELPQQHVCKEEEILTDQQLFNQDRNSSLDQEEPEPPQIKEEQEELCTSQEGEQLVVKLETDDFMLTPADEESDHSEPELERDHHHLSEIHHNNLTELPQQHVCKEEEVFTDQQLFNQARNSSLDQEEPEPPQIKEEQEELCTSQEGEQLVVKLETDDFMLTPADEESDHSEPELERDHQLLSINCPIAESQDQRGGEHGDSGTTRDEPEPKTEHHERGSHSSNENNTNMSEIQHNHLTGKRLSKCDTCGKTFKYRSNFYLHLRTHTGERPYSCKICGKCFVQNDHLKVHMRTHTGERPYSCKICGKCFKQNDQLKVHMRTHTGERPYSCKTCGKDFGVSSALKVHMRIHTGERPYLCNTCGKGCISKSSLMIHMRFHTGERPFTCSTCGRGFTQSGDLKSHMKRHTSEKPYFCKACGKGYSNITYYTKHMKSHTSE